MTHRAALFIAAITVTLTGWWLSKRYNDRQWADRAAKAAMRLKEIEYLAVLEKEIAGSDLEVLAELLDGNGSES